jgi:hypothetical protein
MELNESLLDQAFSLLSEKVKGSELSPLHLLVCGGSALIVTGLRLRGTQDVDVLAYEVGSSGMVKSRPLPEALHPMIRTVADVFGLKEDWLNDGPSTFFDIGMPEGVVARTLVREYDEALKVSYIGRWDQIHLKLYACCSSTDITHFLDLDHLQPTQEEMEAAAVWVRRRCHSDLTRGQLKHMLRELGYADLG